MLVLAPSTLRITKIWLVKIWIKKLECALGLALIHILRIYEKWLAKLVFFTGKCFLHTRYHWNIIGQNWMEPVCVLEHFSIHTQNLWKIICKSSFCTGNYSIDTQYHWKMICQQLDQTGSCTCQTSMFTQACSNLHRLNWLFLREIALLKLTITVLWPTIGSNRFLLDLKLDKTSLDNGACIQTYHH